MLNKFMKSINEDVFKLILLDENVDWISSERSKY